MPDESVSKSSGNGSDKKSWVIARSGDEFRIYSPTAPQHVETVRLDGIPSCTCPEFGTFRKPCIHISVVLAARGGRLAPAPVVIPPAPAAPEASAPERRASASSDDAVKHMLLKRSVSPDGRIDSLSVEFALPIAKLPASEILASAARAISLQTEIVGSFRGSNGREKESAPTQLAPTGAVPALILGVEAMVTKWGRRLYLSFQVQGEEVRYIGSLKKLGDALVLAGYPNVVRDLVEGLRVNLPCRVTTKYTEDGKYLRIEQIFPPNRKENGHA